MVEKKISIYGALEAQSPFNSDQLLLDISNTHMALLVKMAGKDQVAALEIFTFNSRDTEWYDIFYQIRTQSVILDRSFNDTRVFYNLKDAIIVPAEKFNVNSAEVYLNTIHGESINQLVKYDHLSIQPEMVNVYRVKKALNDMVNANLMMVTPHHVFSKILENIFSEGKSYYSAFIKLQIYHHQFVMVLVNNNTLQFIQSYDYQTAEDVLYYLLNLIEQFNLSVEYTEVELSGFIQTRSNLFDYIQKVFPKISFDKISDELLLKENLEEYPPHYFSPFLNLAV
jgi:hypothetical protein